MSSRSVVERARDPDEPPGRVRRLRRRHRPRGDRHLDPDTRSKRHRLERIGVERRRPAAARRRAARRPAAAARPSSRASRPVPGAAVQPEHVGQRVAGLERELVVPGHDRRPAASTSPPMNSMARRDGKPRRRVERPLPVELQPESRSRAVATRASLAPCEIVPGRTPGWRSRRTWRNAAPFGAQTHLWRLPA